MSRLTIQQHQEMNLHYHYRSVINNLISYMTSVSPQLSPSESGESSPPFHHGKFDSDSDLPSSPVSILFSSPLSSLHTLSLDLNSPQLALSEVPSDSVSDDDMLNVDILQQIIAYYQNLGDEIINTCVYFPQPWMPRMTQIGLLEWSRENNGEYF